MDRNSIASNQKNTNETLFVLLFAGMPAVYAACGTLAAVIFFFGPEKTLWVHDIGKSPGMAAALGALVTYALTPRRVAGQNGLSTLRGPNLIFECTGLLHFLQPKIPERNFDTNLFFI